MTAKPTFAVALNAQLVELSGQAPAEFRLMPAGRFKAKDGRPAGLKHGWNLTDALAQKLIDAANRQNDRFLIDYDHQTLHAKDHGGKAPAAGWFSRLEWRPGDGLYALGVEWTAAAQAAIDAKEYRYISPVLTYDAKTGDVTGLLMAAIVNYPALDGLTDLANALSRSLSPAEGHLFHLTRIPPMTELLKRLGLPEDADETAALSALDAILAERDQAKADHQAALSATPDPAKFAPVDALRAFRRHPQVRA